MALDTETIMWVAASGIIGWLANNLVGRLTRQTDTEIPASVNKLDDAISKIESDLRQDIKDLKKSVEEIKLTLEAIKNGFVTRDKMDEKIKEVENKNQASYKELKEQFDKHVKEYHGK